MKLACSVSPRDLLDIRDALRLFRDVKSIGLAVRVAARGS